MTTPSPLDPGPATRGAALPAGSVPARFFPFSSEARPDDAEARALFDAREGEGAWLRAIGDRDAGGTAMGAVSRGRGLEALARQIVAEASARSIVALSLDDFLLSVQDEPDWLVEDLIPAASWTIFAGPPRSFKTMAAQNIAVAVAAGTSFLGRDVKQPGKVLYIIEEGKGKAVAERFARLRNLHGRRHEVLIAYKQRIKMDVPELWDQIRDLVRENQPVLVVVDTWARCYSGNENDAREVGMATAALDALVAESGCTVLVVHHTNKANEGAHGYKLRGSGALPAAPQGIALFDPEYVGGVKTNRGSIKIETKDTETETILFELDLLTYALTTPADVARPTPELLHGLAVTIIDTGTRATSRNLRLRWQEEHPQPVFGETRWKEFVAAAVTAGQLVPRGNGPTTHYILPLAEPEQLTAIADDAA